MDLGCEMGLGRTRVNSFSVRAVIGYLRLAVLAVGLYSTVVHAEFLEMPEIEQLRDVEQKTLLRDLDIPPVRDRSPDPLAGPRLAVSEFRIQGLVEYPELGITRKTLAQLVEGIRFDLMAEGKLLESGYTIEELGELSDLLVEIEEETMDRHVTPLEVQKLVWLIRDQRGKRGVTLGQIETVANKITQFYRERGFILAKAYIPKQKVRDGVVNLTLLLGMLGEVEVNGNDMYDTETLRSVFDDQMAMPVTNEAIEEKLFIINDFPGLSVDGYFEPGYQVGDTKLNINVKAENRYDANIRLDNHGTDESGLYRLYADIQANNVIGTSDYIHASVLEAAQPSNTTYWQLDAESKVYSPRFRLRVDASQNQFIVDQSSFANIDLNGTVDVFGITGRYISQRGRTKNTSYELRYETIKSDLQIGNLPDINNSLDEELTHYSIQYNFDSINDAEKRLQEGNIKYTKGSFDFGAEQEQDESYDILSGNYTLLTFMKVPFTEKSNSRLIFRTNLQYSGKNLSSIVRFSLAGPTRARGFSPSLFTADDAIYLGADWIFNAPDLFDFEIGGLNVKELAKPFVFVDYAYGKQHSIAPPPNNLDTTGEIADIGVGLQFSYGYQFSGNLMIAYPILDDFSDENFKPDIDSSRVVFDFQYSF